MLGVEDRGGIHVVTLSRPPVNALNLELVSALAALWQQLRDEPACKGVVLTGPTGVFSAGIDTREVPAYDAATRSTMLRTINRMIRGLYTLPKPVVAAVSGHALGGAFVLVLSCDLRLLAEGDFRFGLTEAAAGIAFPAAPLAVVRAELSPEHLRVLALGSQPVDQAYLLRRGIVDRVVQPAALVETAVQEAQRLAAMPAYGRVKLQIRAAASERLRQIEENDDEPLHRGWA